MHRRRRCRRGAGAPERRAAGGLDRRSHLAGNREAAVGGGHRLDGMPVLRSCAELRRTVCGRDRDQGKVRAADAGATGRRDQGQERQARLRADALDARAAHPPREGDLEHLHQSGADRDDVYGLSDGVRARRAEGIGGAQSGEGRVCRAAAFIVGQAAVCVLAAVQRIRAANGRRSARDQPPAVAGQDHRRTALAALVSGTGQRGGMVLHRHDLARADRCRSEGDGRRRRISGNWWDRK